MKKIVTTFLSLVAALALTGVAQAENMTTFNLLIPKYYISDGSQDIMKSGDPDFISGTRGLIPSFESFPATSSYYCESGAGYGVKKWVLTSAGGAKTIQTWTTSSISITFDYKWAAKYGTTLELVVYLEPLNYNLSYSANGGEWASGEPEGGTYSYFDTLRTPSASTVSYAPRTLRAWQYQDLTFGPNTEFTGASLGVTNSNQNITLYAQWSDPVYKVTLAVPVGADVSKVGTLTKASSDGEWDYYTTTYTYGEEMTLPQATSKRSNTTFVGWYDNANYIHDPTSGIFSMVTKISATDKGDKKFWGKFETKYAVHFDRNGASGGSMADQTFVAGETFSLSENKFTRAYTVKFNVTANGGTGTLPDQTASYTFSHWNIASDGTGEYRYSDGESVTFTNAMTLYAQWTPQHAVSITLPEVPERAGYGKGAWYAASSGGTPVGFGGDPYEPSSSITLYAQWEGHGELSAAVGLTNATLTTWCTKSSAYIKAEGKDNLWKEGSYGGAKCLELDENQEAEGATSILAMSVTGKGKIRFSITGMEGDEVSFYYGGPAPETLQLTSDWETYTRDVPTGKVQVKWSVISKNNQVWIDDITWTPGGSETKVAIAVKASDAAGGTVSGAGEYAVGSTATLTASAKEGYKFTGWRKGDNASIVSTEASYDVKVTEAATYVAVFASVRYNIAYNSNGGTGSMAVQHADRDVAANLTANAFTRSGYAFAGWSTAPNGAVQYADRASVMNLAEVGATITLYAQWTGNGGGGEEGGGEGEGGGEEQLAWVDPVSSVGETVSESFSDCFVKTVLRVSGLPTGLKFTKSTGLVTGKPTKAVSKENNVTVIFTDKTTTKVTWTVTALPAMMVGTYYGRVGIADGSVGMFQLRVTAMGRGSGCFYAAGKRIAFTVTKLASADGDYVLTIRYTYNKTKYTEDQIWLTRVATVEGVDVWGAEIGEDSEVLYDVEARRDTVKECCGKLKAATYDVCEKTEDGEYLTARVTSAGSLLVRGKLAADTGKLISVTQSTHLVVDNDGNPFAYIAIYKTVTGSEPVEYSEDWGR